MMEDKAIAIIENEPITPVRRSILTISEQQVQRIKLLAGMMADSALEYHKMKSGDIFIKMMKGLEIGLEPVASMDLIDVIQGKPTLKPQGMLALAWGSGLMQSLSITDDGNVCTVKMQRIGSPEHVETFSASDAKSMGLVNKDNWKKQPAVMRKWRAVSAACRIVFPDIIQGMYIPEEIAPNTAVDDSGEVVDVVVVEEPKILWPSSESVKWVMNAFRDDGLSDSEIFELAKVTALNDGDGWRRYATPQNAVTAIQEAFDKATNGNEPMVATFNHMRYVGKGGNLIFATSDPDKGEYTTAILFSGRSGITEMYGNDELYEQLNLSQYDTIKDKPIVSDWKPMTVPVDFEFESNRNKDSNEEYFAIIGIAGDPVIQF